jgi:lambda repressor-like predicted transcriptional regulator
VPAVAAATPPAGHAISDGSRAVGVLRDGTPYFVPIGEVRCDGSRVTCHLCGRTFRSVAAHLASHGWTKTQYCEAFGLERGQSLEGAETRKLRSTAFTARLIFEPAVRDGSARGRQRARSGELARDAADAARGRPFPEQRRRRSATPVPAAARAARARASRDQAAQHLAAVADKVARESGYLSIGELVRDRLGAGRSLAAISRECGLGKDWMSRHLPRLDPLPAAEAAGRSAKKLDGRWSPVITSLGFDDLASYLRERHCVQHMSVNAIAREAGVSFHTVKAALRRHGLEATRHAAKRHAAQARNQDVAASLGADSIADFVQRARAQGRTWREMAAEAGQPQTWLRRQAGTK